MEATTTTKNMLTPRERLLSKMRQEQAYFRQQILSGGPNKRGDRKAFEYIMREYIFSAVKAGSGNAEVLLRTKYPLADIYHDIKYYFDGYESSSFKVYVEKAIEDCTNNILRKEFLRAKGWPATDE